MTDKKLCHLCRKFSLDDLLTNVMIYWTTGSITSSMRFYKENLGSNLNNRVDFKYVTVYSPHYTSVLPCHAMPLIIHYIFFVLGQRFLCPLALQPFLMSSATAPSHGHKLGTETSSPTLSCPGVATLQPLKSPSCLLTTCSILSRRWRSPEALSELADQL